MLGLRKDETDRRVERDAPVGGQPGEEGLDRDDALGLGAERERCAVGLLMVEEVALVRLEGGKADRLRFGDVEGGQELDEVGQMVGAAGDGGLGVAVTGQPGQVSAVT